MDAYAAASEAMFEVFRDTTPFVEELSIDEAFLDVGGLRRLSGSPTQIAAHLLVTARKLRERSITTVAEVALLGEPALGADPRARGGTPPVRPRA